MQLFIEQLLNGLAAGSMYAPITLGLALIYGVMKILHVAHASVYTAGAYTGLYIYTSTGRSVSLCRIDGFLRSYRRTDRTATVTAHLLTPAPEISALCRLSAA